MGHPLTLSIALIWAVSVFLWMGDLESAEDYTDRLITHAEPSSFGPYLPIGRAFRGAMAVRRGDAAAGVESLQSSLKELHAAPYELLTTSLNMALAQGFAATGRLADALDLINETIRSVDANGDFCYVPELLRRKANLLRRQPVPVDDEVEICLTQSLELSRRQGARAWELRTATDLAALWADKGRPVAAQTLLQPVLLLFEEGFDTVDIKAAKQPLAGLA